MVSLKTTIFTKTALSRRLLRFHQPGDAVYIYIYIYIYIYATMVSFFIKVLKSPRNYDFLEQIELDDTVDKMKKFQALA